MFMHDKIKLGHKPLANFTGQCHTMPYQMFSEHILVIIDICAEWTVVVYSVRIISYILILSHVYV